MAIIQDKSVVSSGGVKKGIDEQSMGIALDVLQKGLYAHPIQSTIRELASNGHDAVQERETARAILEGRQKVEDHYETKVDTAGVFHSSGWDPGYYDPAFFSDDMNTYIFYDEGKERDVVRIVDNGVGLWHERLKGYFSLNYSSKRLTKTQLGRFGLGSKVPLSLNIDSFRMITRYNGKEAKFDIYVDKFDSIVPKFGNSGINNHIVLQEHIPAIGEPGEDGYVPETPEYRAYYEPTTKKNGVEIQFEVIKHTKSRFFEAVRHQLMYMPGIVFQSRSQDDLQYTKHDIKAKILFKNEDIIISEQNLYQRPHVLIGAGDALINYGAVSFEELELDPKKGAVGLILDMNDIEVTPSREACVWSAKTRNAVLKKYDRVKEIARGYIEKELDNETDYLSWLIKSANAITGMRSGSKTGNTTLSHLASVIDIADVPEVKFKGDASLYFEASVEKMFSEDISVRLVNFEDGKIKRTPVTNFGHMSNADIYLNDTDENADRFLDRYLYTTGGNKPFIMIAPKGGIKKVDSEMDLLLLDSPLIKSYRNQGPVPEDVLELYKSEEEAIKTGKKEDSPDTYRMTPHEVKMLRKQRGEVTLHVPAKDDNGFKFVSDVVKLAELRQKGEFLVTADLSEKSFIMDVINYLPKYLTHLHQYYYEELSERLKNRFPLKRIYFCITSQEARKRIDALPNTTTLKDALISSYNPKNGKLTFSNYIKSIASIAFVTNGKRDMIRRMYNHHSDFKEVGEDHLIQQPWLDWVLDDDFSARKDISKHDFFKDCIKLHACELGYFDLTDSQKQGLIDSINMQLPESFCNGIGQINSVSILDSDLIKETEPVTELIDEAGIYLAAVNHLTVQYNNTEMEKRIVEILSKGLSECLGK